MQYFNISHLIFSVVLAFTSFTIMAQDTIKDPRQVIQDSTEEVLNIIEQQKKEDQDKATSDMAEELLQTLEPSVDFKAIAMGVMGKHAKDATEKQKEEFVSSFKRGLSKLYVKNFQRLDIQHVEVLPLPENFNAQNETRASVDMKASTSNNKKFSITYSMRRDDGNQPWKVQNIIIDGVNLGLVYMNQFDGAMTRHENINEVINNWSDEVKEVDKL